MQSLKAAVTAVKFVGVLRGEERLLHPLEFGVAYNTFHQPFAQTVPPMSFKDKQEGVQPEKDQPTASLNRPQAVCS